MEFKLTIGVTPELQNSLDKIANALSLVPSAVPAQTNGKAESNGSAKAAKVVKAATETQPAKEVAPTETTAKELELKHLRALVNTKAQEDKRDGIRTLLTEFGVEKITELKAEQYAAFFEKLQNL